MLNVNVNVAKTTSAIGMIAKIAKVIGNLKRLASVSKAKGERSLATKKDAWDKSALLYVRRGFSDNVLPCKPLKLRKIGGNRLAVDPKVVRGSDEIAKVMREAQARRLKGGMW